MPRAAKTGARPPGGVIEFTAREVGEWLREEAREVRPLRRELSCPRTSVRRRAERVEAEAHDAARHPDRAWTAARQRRPRARTQELLKVLRGVSVTGHFGVPISVVELAARHCNLAAVLMQKPAETLRVLDEALVVGQEGLLRECPEGSAKEDMHVKARGALRHLSSRQHLANGSPFAWSCRAARAWCRSAWCRSCAMMQG